jgi:hypothetical protein
LKRAVIKPAFSAGSYLTEVFESVNSNHINTKYQTIAAEKELLPQEFMPEIQTLRNFHILIKKSLMLLI